MIISEYFTAEWNGYHDETDETYILEYWFHKNQLPVVRHNPLFLQMLLIDSFNCS